MDGNGRWARSRGLPRIEGHRKGVASLKKIVKYANKLGIEVLTCYAFSKENWRRPPEEVSFLMKLLKFFARRERLEMMEENIQFSTIGRIDDLPPDAIKELEATKEVTAENTGLKFQLALNYGGRDEIIRAVNQFIEKRSDPGLLTEEIFESYLDTAGQPEIDLIIRTSGEMRISNFLLWQSAYSEFFFTDVLWPDFDEQEFQRALDAYLKRERRYGGVTAKPQSQLK